MTACMPTPVAARGIFQGNIDLTYDSTAIPNSVRPESQILLVPVEIKHFVSGVGSQIIIPFYKANTAPIYLSVAATPDYMEAAINPGVVYPLLTVQKPDTPEPAILSISFFPTAPAFQRVNVQVIAETRDMPPVRGTQNTITIPVISGYYSNFKYENPTFKEIGAGETATFPIKIQGYANARSKLQFEAVDIPEGWSASINSEIFLGTSSLGEDATATVDLVVQSPLDFGYYNTVEQLTVRVRTFAAGHVDAGYDNSTTLQFTIRARGFSTPGFEGGILVLAIIAAILIARKKYHK
ncbi:MAG: hypothetical protein KKG04_09720, partial [Candidatus Thermoplasmatota archaeon]|nr:hypothetical protein [Candidatus Thermoplasmatota archaeon]